MIETLNRFTSESLFSATSALLEKLHIQFDRETAEPLSIADFWNGPMPQYLKDAQESMDATYFIGIVNDGSLQGEKNADSLESVASTIEHGGKYDGMFVFAVDVKPDANLTRTLSATLTRAFNRIASANPVILFIRQGNKLSIATCERMEYNQAWRQGSGEKLGKVNILRNINCEKPHPGHKRILDSLGDKQYATFEELYKHWLEVFSSELLTKQFYNELSDWYAWAVQVAKFPNDIRTDEDDAKYNHESCIRLITRLIFVWFLKEKHLIPEEFFDEGYIRHNLIENFDPHDRKNLMYDAEKSKYYRLILQNLFFAMLNCPIVAEGKDTPNNRRFMKESFHGKNPDFNIKTVMRYKAEFMAEGPEKFLELANKYVPFLNGGLFDCLDDSSKSMYYDGFSERKESLDQLNLPDYLFFGEEVGYGIDLSEWYGDKNKKKVSARGLIDILKRYSFTIEENTPYDQEVSLDPELLGKVFENLLAAFNPETQTSARKQTGSFYTPREIVQYMVDESLVAHLKRMCGDEQEPLYRSLISYATEDVEMTDQQRDDIMHALYNCRVLDPACGSGAFPMGVLQQMVHVLKRIDPTNEKWNSMMVDIAIKEARKELEKVASGNEAEKAKIEENRKARLDDIEQAFNKSINDPDYARKLYLIEHCIYGVDIQPIATQISKLRFFISLVVDQKPTSVAKENFGIRPLPNLESKFVTANTLIPVDYDPSLVENAPDVIKYKEELKELNHKIFLAKRNRDKEQLKDDIKTARKNLAKAISETGFVSDSVSHQLASWDMFDQNASASFFDPEWMFGVKLGFDVVIANPPYVAIRSGSISAKDKAIYKNTYRSSTGQFDLYSLFMEFGLSRLHKGGVFTMITESTFLSNKDFKELRCILLHENTIKAISYLGETVFNTAQVDVCISLILHTPCVDNDKIALCNNPDDFIKRDFNYVLQSKFDDKNNNYEIKVKSDDFSADLFESMQKSGVTIADIAELPRGAEFGANAEFIADTAISGYYKLIVGKDVKRYAIDFKNRYIPFDEGNVSVYKELWMYQSPKLLIQRIRNLTLKDRIVATYDDTGIVCTNTLRMLLLKDDELSKKYDLKVILALLNSSLVNYLFRTLFLNKDIYKYQLERIPMPVIDEQLFGRLKNDVTTLLDENRKADRNMELMNKSVNDIDHIVYHLYNLTYDEVLVIDPSTPITREEYDDFKIE